MSTGVDQATVSGSRKAAFDVVALAASAGGLSGEEVYTLAIVLCEALGVTWFRERVKIQWGTTDSTNRSRRRSSV